MEAERWQRIEELLHAALQYPREERGSFLDQACAADLELRREVESLLAASSEAGDFLEQPALEAEVRARVAEEIESMVGRRIGYYVVESLIGAGGMGRVYLARDERLNRRIALKVLPPSYSLDEGRVRRFEREARAASALNHPNILTVYEVGRVDGCPYIATEFIEGETLRGRLEKGTVAFGETIEIALQVASALVAAHASGIVHRDIKPENIMVRPDGLVKVLDFGIAKLGEEALAGSAATISANAESRTGSGILGTARYMSPEQARGEQIDARTDLFSLGVVLYEMLSGEAPFSAAQPAEPIPAILEREPVRLQSVASGVPAGLARIVERALEKDRAARYQKAEEMLGDLKELKRREDLALLPARRRKRVLWAVATLLLIASGLGGLRFLRGGSQAASFGAMRFTSLTNNGKVGSMAISPDGRYLAYAATSVMGGELWLRQMDSGNHHLFASSPQTSYASLVFSPAGDYLYYLAPESEGGPARTLFRRKIAGGEPVKVITGVDGKISFSPDGRRFLFHRYDWDEHISRLLVANADGSGEQQIVMRLDGRTGFYDAAFSPDGKRIAGTVMDAHGRYLLVEVNPEDGKEHQFTTGQWESILTPTWLADGGALIAVARPQGEPVMQIWRFPYPEGEAQRITNDLNNYQDVSLTADGRALVARQTANESNLWLIPDGDINRARQMTFGKDAGMGGIAWTPDGKIIYPVSDGGQKSIWMMHADGSENRQLMSSEGVSLRPKVTRDGRYLLYEPDHIWRFDLSSGETRELVKGLQSDATPDGKWVIYFARHAGKPALWKVSIDGGDPVYLFDLADEPYLPGKSLAISPDGTKIAYVYHVSGKTDIGGLRVISSATGAMIRTFDRIHPRHGIEWSSDGSAIIYTGGGQVRNIWSQALAGGPPRKLTDFKEDGILNCAQSPDGRQFACRRGKIASDVVMISNYQ